MSDPNLISSPKLPFVTLIPGGVRPGKAITVKGLISTHGKRCSINLCNGLLIDGDHKDDIALHVDYRMDEKDFVLNSLVNNTWGPEERHNAPLLKGQPYSIRILILTNSFKIAVNNEHLADYRHRLPVEDIKIFYLPKGCLQAEFIHFEGEEALDPAAAHKIVPTAPLESCQGPTIFQKPMVPFHHPLRDFGFGKQISISGTPFSKPGRFHINLCADPAPNIALHFDVRFDENIVVRNVFRNRWEIEDRSQVNFPFIAGGTFDLTIICQSDGFRVTVNGQHYTTFSHRMSPNDINKLEIDGTLKLQKVTVQ